MFIPKATYRIQFNPSFGFYAAKEILSYLKELGISHLYASPIFKAKKGSAHGYDVVDPNQLNPELGDNSDFEKLIQELKVNNMYWIQDIVPNHMAYDSQNQMLMDVLEKGEHSRYFHFFDIQWDHYYENLKGRLLAPFLGKFYAEALEQGEIQLKYEETGLWCCYYSYKFPLALKSYSQVFSYDLKALEERLGKGNGNLIKYIGEIQLFENLLSKQQTKENEDLSSPLVFNNEEQRAENQERFSSDEPYDQTAHAKEMLWELYMHEPAIKEFMDKAIAFFNGKKGDLASFSSLDSLLSNQLYRLSFWKVSAEELNYRRFFNINELISVRVEDKAVFDYTHELIFKLIKEEKVAGLRVDHIDGLYDPTSYLKKLSEETDKTYIVVEKILDFGEEIPNFWPIQGTTGYKFLNYVNGVFCKKENKSEFRKIYHKLSGLNTSYEDLIWEKKRLVIWKHLAGNIDNLAHLIKKIASSEKYGRDITLHSLRRALVETMAFFPVYRTYINKDMFSETDRNLIVMAIDNALLKDPDLMYELNFIKKFFHPDFPQQLTEEERAQLLHFIMTFQQFTGPLMAKGFEDTVLYIYNQLISLNEVGGNPHRFGVSLDEFHSFNTKRASRMPHSLNATATHDTKRGEDLRARINVLSELPTEWTNKLKHWKKINSVHKIILGNRSLPDENDEYFLYQTFLGAFPFLKKDIPAFKERIKTYIIKAVREAKVHTAWVKPDTEYEEACLSFVEKTLNSEKNNLFFNSFIPFQKKIAFYGIFNSLSQILLKITCPGIPDFYQGTELWDLNLVDPDNRRPVDFQMRKKYLKEIKQKEQEDILALISKLLDSREDGRIKLFLVYRSLKLREERRDVFEKGTYLPIKVEGRFKECIIAYVRAFQKSWIITIAPRYFTSLVNKGQYPLGEEVWRDTHLLLPDEAPFNWKNVITNQEIRGEGLLSVGKVLQHFSVALLYG
ncbi:MAG: malto-oligosyltrehalose synthase [bacterium]